jgi:hypothetical protein
MLTAEIHENEVFLRVPAECFEQPATYDELIREYRIARADGRLGAAVDLAGACLEECRQAGRTEQVKQWAEEITDLLPRL